MNNDELQKAIDDITRDTNTPASAEANDSVNEALVEEMAGVSTGGGVKLAPISADQDQGAVAPETPVASTAEAPVAPAPMPVVPETPAMPPATEMAAQETNQDSAAEASAAVEESGSAEGIENGLEEVEREALKELYPLLSKVELPAEEKFEICMRAAEDDRRAIIGALDAAKGITDEVAKANALLRILGSTR